MRDKIFGNQLYVIENKQRKRMGSGDPPGLQNRWEAGLPVSGAFDSHTLPPSFSVTCRTHLPFSPAIECQSRDFRGRLRHLIGDHVAVHVHRGADVRVSHQLFLHGNRGSYRVQP